MKSILYFFLHGFISLNIAVMMWLISFFGFDMPFGISALIATIGGACTYYLLKWSRHQKLLKHNQLSKKEYQYIHSNLKEAQLKIKRLNKSLLGIRSISTAFQIGKLQRMVNKIYQIIENEPKRFYQAERFFFYHLDSIVELSERYIFLSRQQVKDQEVRNSLAEAEQTLKQLSKSLDEDLLAILANDIDTLNIELDVANQTYKQENSISPKERRS